MSELLRILKGEEYRAPLKKDLPPTGDVTEPGPFSRELFLQNLNDEMSGPERFAVGFDRAVTRLGQAITGQREDPATKQAADDLRDRYPEALAGDVVGTTAALAPLAALPGGATIRGKELIKPATSFLGRVSGAGATGAAEGALIAQTENRDIVGTLKGAGAGGAIAGVAEAVIPVLGRLAGQVYRSVTGKPPVGALVTREGKPTQEMLDALSRAGINWDDLSNEALEYVYKQPAGVSPDELARGARFKSQGIRATKGNITQDFAQQAKEARLAEAIDVEQAAPLRAFQAGASDDFIGAVSQEAGRYGNPERLGSGAQRALTGRRDALKSQKNRLYKEAEKAAREIGGYPLNADSVMDALPDRKTLRRLSRIEGSQMSALQDLLVEFGIDNSDEAVEQFTKAGGEIIPLSIENVEDFRSALNQITRSDSSGAATVAVAPIRDAVDSQVDEIITQLEKNGTEGAAGFLETLRNARDTTRQLKTEFSDQSFVGRLVGTKRDGVTPVIEASKVFDQLKSRPVEDLQRTLSSLAKSGDAGRAAIGDLRAAVIMDALEAALKAPSNKYGGKQMANTGQFAKWLDQKYGKDRLKVLFKGDDQGLRRLIGLSETAKDLMPAAGAIPKGSASVNAEIARNFQRVVGPAAAAILAPLRVIAGPAADNAAVRGAMSEKLARKELQKISSAYPALMAALGISVTTKEDE